MSDKLPADFAGWADDQAQGVLNLDAPTPPPRPADLGAVPAPVPPPRPDDLGMQPVAVQNPPEPPARPAEFGPSAKMPADFAGWADEAPGIGEVAARALGKGIMHGYETAQQGAQVIGERGFTGLKQPEAVAPDAVDQIMRKPLSEGWSDPNWWTAQILHGLGGSWPALGAGVAGGAAGGAVAGPLGALGGSAAGFGAGAALQTLAPAYLKARQEGLDHDKAVDRAMVETGISGAVGTALGAAPAFRPFKQAIADSMLMLFGTAPTLMAGQKAAENYVEGKPLGEGVGETAAVAIGTGAALLGAHGARRAIMPERAPTEGLSVDDFLRLADEAEARARGARTRAEIDEWIRQKEAQDAVREGAARQLPAPGVSERPAEPASAAPERPVDQGPVQGRPEDRNDVRQPGPADRAADDTAGRGTNAEPGVLDGGKPDAPVDRTRAAEDDALRAAGWIDEDIESMSAKQRKSELEAVGFQPPKDEAPEFEPITLDQRLDAYREEFRNMPEDATFDERGIRQPGLRDALDVVSSPFGITGDHGREALDLAIKHDRPDIAEALVQRAERSAQTQNTTPGVAETSPKYNEIKRNLERLKKEAEDYAVELREKLNASKLKNDTLIDGARPAEPASAAPERPVDQGPAQGRPEDRNDVRQPGPADRAADDATRPAPVSEPGAVPAGEPAAASVDRTRAAEDAALRAAGWIDEDIESMSAKQRKSELEAVGFQPPKDEAPAAAPAQDAGTRAKPVKVETPEDMAPARDRVDQEPTDAQIEAGNYRKGHVVYDGLPVSIENPKGSTRRGVAPDGSPWEVAMPGDYGYIKNSKGADKDHVDILIGDKPPNGKVFVVDQHDPATNSFDEHKIIAGVNSVGEAARLYGKGFSDGSGPSRIGAITEVPTSHLQEWLAQGHRTEPMAPPPAKGEAKPADAAPEETKTLYRFEPRKRETGKVADWVSESDAYRNMLDAEGRWFAETPEEAEWYKKEHPDGHLVSVDVPASEAERYRVSNMPKKAGGKEASDNPASFSARPEKEFFLPRKLADKRLPVSKDWEAEGRRAYETSRERMVPDGLKGEDARAWERGNRAAQADATKAYVARARRNAANRMPTSLVQFLRGMGGVRDDGGDLKSQDMHRRFIGLVSSRGVSLDQAREAAAEAGYLGHDKERAVSETTVSDLLDALMDHPRYSVDDEQQVHDMKDKLAAKKHERRIAAKKMEISSFMDEHGLSPDPEAVERAAALMVDDGLPMEEAFERAVMQLAHETPETKAALDATATEDGFDAIPWDEWTGPVGEPVEEAAASPTRGGDQEAGGSRPARDEGGSPRADSGRSAEPARASGNEEDQAPRDEGKRSEPDQDAEVEPTEAEQHAASRRMEDALNSIEVAQESGDRAKVLEAARKAKRVLAETPEAITALDPEYWAQFPAAIKRMSAEGWKPITLPEATEPTVEPGADNKPQTVIPGAEKISDKALAEKKADEGLKPKVPQKGAGGMFDEANTSRQLFDAKPEPATPATVATPKPQQSAVEALRDHFLDKDAEPFPSIVQARKFALDNGFKPVEGLPENKQIEELIEHALVLASREIVARDPAPLATFDKLVNLYNSQPRLGSRTSTSIAEQAYSTPAPLAYVASRLAGIDPTKTVLEPTAGNGMLLIEAAHKNAAVNELNKTRADALEAQGFRVMMRDAADPDRFADVPKVDVVIANPPFGAVREGGESKTFRVPGLNTTAVDYAIALNALEAMKPDGRAVLILGGVKAESLAERQKGYMGAGKRKFFHVLLNKYKVADIFTVSGDLYERQGAGWPVDVVVIDGKGKSDRKPLTAEPPPLLKTWGEIKEKLNGAPERGVLGDGSEAPRAPDAAGGKPARDDAGSGEPAIRGESVEPQAPEGQRAPVGPKPDRGQPADAGRSGVGDQPRPAAEPVRERPRTDYKPDPERGRPVKANSAGQVDYRPSASAGRPLGSLLPANLRTATEKSLDRVQRERGQIDQYVADALGYDLDQNGMFFRDGNQTRQPFSAEQIDAIGLALDNIEKGDGFILGDQTGIGKGRVVAAAIRYAHRKGLVPVFVTEKPDLFGDMWRDLHDIGWPQALGRPINMFMTNSGIRLPLDEKAVEWVAARNAAKDAGEPLPPLEGQFSKSQTPETSAKRMAAILAGEDTPDVVFTTYDQMNSVRGQETDRRAFLRRVAPKAFLILDEAHNAGGQGEQLFEEKDKAAPRSVVFREAVTAANSVLYSSATYAKSPKVMDLFSRTDMAKAVEDPKDLAELIDKGGIPLQQIVSQMLSDAGQYMRRERSFEGVTYEPEIVPVDEESYETFTDALGTIFRFDRSFAKERGEIAQKIAQELGAGLGKDSGIGEGGASSVTFSAIMHNAISQMVLSIKAKGAAQRAIQAIEAGEKPVIALSATMESFLGDMAEALGLKPGDPINADFGDVLRRYMERTRRVTIKMPDDTKKHVMIPLADMSPGARADFEDASKFLKGIEMPGLPLSPIDAIRSELQKAGYSVREITGRSLMIDYTGDEPVLAKRPEGERGSTGKRLTIKSFNDGKLDAVILNRSGSTGVSMHASEFFKDRRKRRMILVQADPNIDTHMQMLGRIHRTGQVELPAYTQLAADIPAEVRPTAVLMGKMASLNANTTASRKSKFTGESVDFMNKYGDLVAAQVLSEPEMLGTVTTLDVDLKNDNGEIIPGLIAKVTGRLTLLRPKEQQALIDRITEEYKQLIARLDAEGLNDLEAKSIDLQARVVETKEIKPATGTSPFTSAVNLDKVSVKAQGRAMAPGEVLSELADRLDQQVNPDGDFASELRNLAAAGEQRRRAMMSRVTEAAQIYAKKQIATLKKTDAIAKAQDAANANLARWQYTANRATPGTIIGISFAGDDTPAIVLDFRFKGKEGSNPVSLAQWVLDLALPNQLRTLSIPASQVYTDAFPKGDKDKGGLTISRDMFAPAMVEAQFENARKEGRETRFIFTGNILAAFDQADGRGQIVNFTMEDGSTQPGILMNRKFDPADFMAGRAIRFKTGAQALAFLDKFPRGEIASKDNVITVRTASGRYEFDLPSAKATGGRFFTDARVRQVYDGWEKRGSRMRATVNGPTARALVDAMMDLGAAFETRENQAAAQEIINADAKAPQMAQAARSDKSWALGPEKAKLRDIDRVYQDVERIISSVLPEGAVNLDVMDGLVPFDDPAALQQSGSKNVADGATGMYFSDGVERLIQVGTASDDTKSTAYHEAWHAVQDLGLASAREINILRSPAERERLRRYADKKNLNGAAMSQAELEANFFGDYAAAMDRGEPPPRLHALSIGVFARLYDLIRRIRNYFRGLGAEITEDIAARFQRGEMRDRPFWDRGESRLYGEDARAPARFAQAAPTPPEERYFGPRPLTERIAHKMARLPDSTDRVEAILDFNAPVEVTAKELADGRRIAPEIDPYKAKRLLPGRTAATQDNFKRDYLEPLVHAAKASKLTLQDIAEWLYAQHAPERNAAMDQVDPKNSGKGSGITDAEAGRIIDRLTAEGKAGSLENIARRVAEIREYNLDLAESAGLMSEEQANELRSQYENYVPLKGWDDPSLAPDEAAAVRKDYVGGRMRVAGREFIHAFGRKTIPSDPLSNLINDTYRMIDRAEKNRALNTIWKFFRSIDPDVRDGIVKMDKGRMVKALDPQTGMMVWREEAAWRFRENVVPLKIGGKPHYLVFEDPELAKAFMRTSAYQLPFVLKQMGQIINLAKSMWTHWNPDFVTRHFFLRYPIEGASNAGENGLGAVIRSFKGYPGGPAYKAIRRHQKLDEAGRNAAIARLSDPNATMEDKWLGYYEELRRAGGLMNWADFGGVDRVRKRLDSSLATLSSNPARAALAYGRAVHEGLNIITSAMDNAQRLAAYVDARQAGASRIDAAMAAREATVDFARKGLMANYMTLMWPFANTAGQTADRMVRATRRSKAAMAGVLASWVALGLSAGLFAYLFGGDDKDGKPFIEKIGDWTRRLNLVVPFGPTDDQGRPYMLTISLPYNYALPFTIGQTIATLIMKAQGRSKEKLSHITGNLMHSALEAFTPIAQENSMLGKALPELSRPFLHVAANKNWYGGPVHPNEEPWNRGLPKAERSFRSTPEGWKMLARGLNNYTGFDAHPEDYREVMSYFSSTMQGVLARAGTAAGDAASGKKPDPTDVPIVHALIGGGKQYDAADRRAYFEARDKAYTAETRAKDLRKSSANGPEAVEKARDYQAQNAKDITGAKTFHSTDALRRSLMKQMDRVKADTSISADEKNRRMDVLQKRELELMRRARAMTGE